MDGHVTDYWRIGKEPAGVYSKEPNRSGLPMPAKDPLAVDTSFIHKLSG